MRKVQSFSLDRIKKGLDRLLNTLFPFQKCTKMKFTNWMELALLRHPRALVFSAVFQVFPVFARIYVTMWARSLRLNTAKRVWTSKSSQKFEGTINRCFKTQNLPERSPQHIGLLNRIAVRVYAINLRLVESVSQSFLSFTDLSATGADAATGTSRSVMKWEKCYVQYAEHHFYLMKLKSEK